jgi:broad specificity phosphatase PhoE
MTKTSSTPQSGKNHLYLLRHGENPANLSKIFSCRRVDQALTEKGVLQAQQSAAYFRRQNIQAVYSSPLKRAAQTATIIAGRLGLEVVISEAFREIDVGSLEDRPATAADWTLHNEIIDEWYDGRHETAFPEGENYNDLWSRVYPGLLEATAGRSSEQILVVGHGGIQTVMLKDLCPNVDVAWLRSTHWDNCAFAEIEVTRRQDGQLEGDLLTWNNHGHLHGRAGDLVAGVPDDE